jgi:hypothetical protein
MTYPTHFLTYSFAKGHWAFPNVLNAKRASISGAGLVQQKGKFEALLNRLQNNNDSNIARPSDFPNKRTQRTPRPRCMRNLGEQRGAAGAGR